MPESHTESPAKAPQEDYPERSDQPEQTLPNIATNENSIAEKYLEFPLIDHKKLQALGKGLVEELVDLFAEATPEGIDRLREAYNSSDWKMLGAEAHSLKGSSLNLHFLRFVEICRDLQKVDQKSSSQRVLSAIQQLEIVLNQTLEEAKRLDWSD